MNMTKHIENTQRFQIVQGFRDKLWQTCLGLTEIFGIFGF